MKLFIFRYHVPRSWLTTSGNLLVVFEEWGGDPTKISLVERRTSSVCADIFEGQPTLTNSQKLASGKLNRPKAHLWCPPGQVISDIKFASYGLPQGTCGSFQEGSCHAHKSYDAPKRVCPATLCWYLLTWILLNNCKNQNFFTPAELHWKAILLSDCSSRSFWRRSLSGQYKEALGWGCLQLRPSGSVDYYIYEVQISSIFTR